MVFLRNHLDRIALGCIILAAFILSWINITQQGFANMYYAATVRSMLENWHLFFYASYDPAGFISVDKPPLGFWIQAAFAWIFGYKGWVLILPQVLAFCGSIVLVHRLASAAYGRWAGVLSALFFAFTPINVATARNNTIDFLLLFVLLLATHLLFKLSLDQRHRWLYFAMMLIGAGFQIKMMQAFMILPAVALYYWIVMPLSWKKKLLHLSGAAAVVFVISLSWAIIVDLTPSEQRPFIGSSTNNTVMELIVGHNGFDRWFGGKGQGPGKGPAPAPGEGQALGPGGGQGPGPNNGPQQEVGDPSFKRLFTEQLGGQSSWFLPLALYFVWLLLRKLRLTRGLTVPDRVNASTIYWAIWLVTMVLFFSYAAFYHRYYLIMLAPAISILCGAGLVTVWQNVRKEDPLGTFDLVSGLGITLVTEALILWAFPDTREWIYSIMGGLLLVILLILPFMQNLNGWIGILLLAAIFTAPIYWSTTPMRFADASNLPYAGPGLTHENGQMMGQKPNENLIRFLTSKYKDGNLLVVAANSHQVSKMIIATGLPSIAWGGFNGGDHALELKDLQEMVRLGKATYFLIGGPNGPGAKDELQDWIRTHAKPVPNELWGGTRNPDPGRRGPNDEGQLYEYNRTGDNNGQNG